MTGDELREKLRAKGFSTSFVACPPAEWFLYTCKVCEGRTFLSPAGGSFNCSCAADAALIEVTPLYAGGNITMADLVPPKDAG